MPEVMGMESTVTTTGETGYARFLYPVIFLLSFGVMSLLSGRAIDPGAGFVVVFTLVGLMLAGLFLCGLAGLAYATNLRLRRTCDYRAVLELYARGFVLLLPFTILALTGEIFLDWSIALVFIQAGIMTSGTFTALEIVKLSDSKASYIIVPILGAFSFSIAWMLFCAAAQAVAT